MRKFIVGLALFFTTCGLCLSEQRIIRPTDQVKSMVGKINSNFKELYDTTSSNVDGDVSGKLSNLQLKPSVVVAADINIPDLVPALTNSLLSLSGGYMTNQYGNHIGFSLYPAASVVIGSDSELNSTIALSIAENARSLLDIVNMYSGVSSAVFASPAGVEYDFNNSRFDVGTNDLTNVGNAYVEYDVFVRGNVETALGFIGDGSQLTNVLAVYGPFNINSFAAHSVYNPQTSPVNYARVSGLSSQPLTTNPEDYNAYVYQNNGGVVHPRRVFGIGVNYKVVVHVRVDNPLGNGLYLTLTKVSPLYTNPGGQVMISGLVDKHMGTQIFSTFESDTLNTSNDNAEGFWFRVHFACDAGGNGALIRDTTVYIQRVP